eukprot:TRINITY_DN37109_c0_g1_i1.p1 TRINITY_DN37109_c0_g1~~TRINITY_DN37109_c0_g1_i1.p1  ORF type:complete len:104 (+),score=12.03 TRINITY_DN37109_c0_g1_i1:109-420(+)
MCIRDSPMSTACKDADDALDESLRSSSPLATITFTPRDIQMWNAGFTYGRSHAPRMVKESAPLPPAATSTTPTATDPSLPPTCLLYTSPSPRDRTRSRMPSSA